MKASISQDLVKVYLDQMAEIPPISADEERVLAAELESSRRLLRDHILAAGLPLKRAIGLLEKIRSKELPIDRVLLLDATTSANRDEIYAKLEAAMPELDKNLKLVERDFRAYLSKELPADRCLRLRKIIRSRFIDCVRILDPFNIQVSRLYPMVEEAQEALRKMKAAKRKVAALELRAASGEALAEAEKQYEDAQVEAFATPKALRRYVEDVATHRATYEDAKRKLSGKNLRLVVSVAKRFKDQGMPFLDLIQEGNMGLMKALDRYEASRGNKFSTYATWWIKQTITRSMAYQSRTVRVPIHAINTLNKLVEERDIFVRDRGTEPTVEELAEKVGVPVEEAKRLLELNRSSFSLDQPHVSDDESHLGEMIEDKNATPAIEVSQRNQLRERLKKILKQLNAREREVLKLRYGLDGGHTYTLEEVGQMFKVSRERIRQLEVGAIQKLQQPARREKLVGFWEELGNQAA